MCLSVCTVYMLARVCVCVCMYSVHVGSYVLSVCTVYMLARVSVCTVYMLAHMCVSVYMYSVHVGSYFDYTSVCVSKQCAECNNEQLVTLL